jgi:hypothetical protein
MEVVPPKDARILLFSSFTVLTSCAGAAYCKLYDCLTTSIATLVCSVNYWRHPVYGWRRNIDIMNISSGAIYHASRALETDRVYCAGYIGFILLGVGCYIISRRTQGRLSVYAHSAMHVLGNLGNVFLYAGLYKIERIETDRNGLRSHRTKPHYENTLYHGSIIFST